MAVQARGPRAVLGQYQGCRSYAVWDKKDIIGSENN